MPLVLTQNESTQSGHSYRDELGVEYEYPRQYQSEVRSGEPFVYYRGRYRPDGSRAPQVYLGTGVVGEIRPSEDPERLVCAVEDYVAFETPLYFKDGDDYFEPLGGYRPQNAGLYFQQGVRPISDETFTRILVAADAADPTAGRRRRERGIPWASPETALRVDDVVMELALAEAKSLYPQAQVRRMPHNNPGYDIRVEAADAPTRYLEVKGTTRALPHFFMSEGERLFSLDHADVYALLIVYGVDLETRTGTVLVRHGAVAGDDFELAPVTWEGTLTKPAAMLQAAS